MGVCVFVCVCQRGREKEWDWWDLCEISLKRILLFNSMLECHILFMWAAMSNTGTHTVHLLLFNSVSRRTFSIFDSWKSNLQSLEGSYGKLFSPSWVIEVPTISECISVLIHYEALRPPYRQPLCKRSKLHNCLLWTFPLVNATTWRWYRLTRNQHWGT